MIVHIPDAESLKKLYDSGIIGNLELDGGYHMYVYPTALDITDRNNCSFEHGSLVNTTVEELLK